MENPLGAVHFVSCTAPFPRSMLSYIGCHSALQTTGHPESPLSPCRTARRPGNPLAAKAPPIPASLLPEKLVLRSSRCVHAGIRGPSLWILHARQSSFGLAQDGIYVCGHPFGGLRRPLLHPPSVEHGLPLTPCRTAGPRLLAHLI